MNILIGIPSKDKIDIECAISLGNLDWDGHSITYTHSRGAGVYGVAQARNNLVQQAIDGYNVPALLMLRYIDGKSWAAISHAIPCSERAVYYLHGRALQHLTGILQSIAVDTEP